MTGLAMDTNLDVSTDHCGESWANAVRFRLGVIAYNLVIGLTRLACPAA